MAEFLNTNGISAQLEEIIKGAESGRLLIISPFLKFNPLIKDLLEDQVSRFKTSVHVVYGKTELRSEETDWLAANDVRTSVLDNLHAKCYLNDNHAIIASMNLYDYSQRNNYEMGILVSAKNDPELYESIKEEAERILRLSQSVRLEVTPVDDNDGVVRTGRRERAASSRSKSQSGRARQRTTLPETGSCLRCGNEIPFDPERPYCNSDYRSWARYKNEEYEEKHCHACGEEHGSSMARPVCISCYRKYGSALRAAG